MEDDPHFTPQISDAEALWPGGPTYSEALSNLYAELFNLSDEEYEDHDLDNEFDDDLSEGSGIGSDEAEPEASAGCSGRIWDEDSLRWICPRLEPLEPDRCPASGRADAFGSIDQLFTNNGYADLLSLVLDHVPDQTLLNISEVCKNAGLVVSKSAQAQLRLRKLFHAVRPDEDLHSPTAPPAAQLAWLLERELRTEGVRAHHAPMPRSRDLVNRQIDDGFVVAQMYALVYKSGDGDRAANGLDLTRNVRKLITILDTNIEDEAAMPVGEALKLPVWRYQLNSRTAIAMISAKDDLMVQAYHYGTCAGDYGDAPHDLWRVEFCRMRSTAKAEEGGIDYDVKPHPLARLPYIDIFVPAFGREGRLDVKIGPGGLLLFSICYLDDPPRQVAVILDWIKGEGVGRIIREGLEAGKDSHAFVNQGYLISTFNGDLGDPSNASSGLGPTSSNASGFKCSAALRLWTVPRLGRRPETVMMSPSTPRYVLHWQSLPRLKPEVSFELPELSDERQFLGGSTSRHFIVDHTMVSTTPSPGRELRADLDLALFSFVGAVCHRHDPSRIRPAQCCGVVQVSKLVDAWHRTQQAEANTSSSADYTLRTAKRRTRHEPVHTVAWRDWQQWTNIFTLNSHLKPVLHGTKVIVGYSSEDQIHAPTILVEGPDEPYGVKFTQLILAIRDFNINRLANPGIRPWHKLGIPLSHPSQPSGDDHDIPDCAFPTLEVTTHGITRGPAQHTRGMFVDKVIRGGLQYHEVTASPAVNRNAESAKTWRDLWVKLDVPGGKGGSSALCVVEELMYDGETLLLGLPKNAVTVELGPRRDEGGPCCRTGKSSRKKRTRA